MLNFAKKAVRMQHRRRSALRLGSLLLLFCATAPAVPGAYASGLVASSVTARSVRSGNWSDPDIWSTAKVPGQGDNVVIDEGHVVVFDLESDAVIRLIHVRGTLSFSPVTNTRLDVGMIILDKSPTVDESANCSAHSHPLTDFEEPRPTLEVGTPLEPIPAGITARIRLTDFDDLNDDCAPGIISYAGRMEIHGAPLTRTWVKLAATAAAGATTITISEPVNWRPGDHVIITGTESYSSFQGSGDSFRNSSKAQTEENFLVSSSGKTITLRTPLEHAHVGDGEFRAEVANLSRNVVIESRDPNGVRGHTMYHFGSRGSISYAEFAHLGKADRLGRYPIHYHVARSSNRGTSVIGASIWDSENRWVTVHGTDYVVVRDCVGYKSLGHGFFLENGSEVYNLFDHNLAVLAYTHKPLPGQALDYDENAGAGFWWANGRNAFTYNTAAECDQYGYQFDVRADVRVPVLQPDGSVATDVQVDRWPFLLFEDNEAHGMMMWAFWGNGNASPDDPFIVRGFRGWQIRYGITPDGQNTLIEDLHLWRSHYGFYGVNPNNVKVVGMYVHTSSQHAIDFYKSPQGLATFEHVFLDDLGEYPLRITGKRPRPNPAEIHLRDYSITNVEAGHSGVGSESDNADPTPELTMYLHDFFGANRDAKVIPATQSRDDGLTYTTMAPQFQDNVKVAEVDVPFPENPIRLKDTRPPATVITFPPDGGLVPLGAGGSLVVRGTSIDASNISSVTVNGVQAVATAENYRQWEATISNLPAGELVLRAEATDMLGNREQNPHVLHTRIAVSTGVALQGEQQNQPGGYELSQNYPNPFNPETRISLAIPGDDRTPRRVRLAVFDILGNEVRRLVDDRLAPGQYQVAWDGRDATGVPAPSGVYFYQLIVLRNGRSEFQQTRKLVLTR